MSARVAALLVVVGFVALVAGVAFVYWPAALILGGGLMVAVGLLVNTKDDAEVQRT